jgi:hypothetical protein
MVLGQRDRASLHVGRSVGRGRWPERNRAEPLSEKIHVCPQGELRNHVLNLAAGLGRHAKRLSHSLLRLLYALTTRLPQSRSKEL